MSGTPKAARRGLGRGLGALIPTAAPEAPAEAAQEPVEASSVAAEAPAATQAPAAPSKPAASSTRAPGKTPVANPRDLLFMDTASRVEAPEVEPTIEQVAVPGAYFAELPIAAVRPNTWQPRQVFEEEALAELVHSIKEVGLLQPIVVRPDGNDTYELIMGERRWRASQEAGLTSIPAIVRDTDDGDMLRDALLENLHRSQLNPLEEAAAYGQLLEDFGCTHEELAQRIGRSRPQISNTLRLLRLPPTVQRRVAAGVLSAGHARALLTLDDAELQDRLAQRVVQEGISVRGLEEIVALGVAEEKKPKARRPKPEAPGAVELANRLADRFDTRVKVDLGKSKGKITVEFATLDDLQRIVALMDPDATN